MAEQVIGIDLGGTAIKLGRFLVDGTCLESITISTPQPAHPQAVIKAIALGVKQLDPNQLALAVGLGVPGPTDYQRRIAKKSINLPLWDDVPAADWLEAQISRPTILENDANCAAMGEAWLGAGQKFQDFILLTLGTGVGGGIFINGRLFKGRCGAAGELGLITLDPQGHPCRSGNSGSLEQHVSIGAIHRLTGKSPAEMGRLAAQREPDALQFWHKYGQTLGAGLASLVYVLTPEVILIGGGISASAEFFLPSALEELEQRVVLPSRPDLQLLPAQLGNQAGMLGAARLVWQELLSQ